MNAIYYQDDDILELRFSDTPITKEISQDWNINLSFDAMGHIVEIVILEAQESGMLPAIVKTRMAA